MSRYVILTGILLALLTSGLAAAQKCEPRPEAWFAEVFGIQLPADFPETLKLVTSPKEVAHGYLEITNDSNAPLYLLPPTAEPTLITTAQPAIADETLNGEINPELILHHERAPDLAAFSIQPGETLHLDTTSLTALLPYIEARNIIDYSRPGLVLLPNTQRGEFLLIHGVQLYTIQLTIGYAFNEGFAAEICGETVKAQTESIAEASPFHPQVGGFMLLIAALLVVGVERYHYITYRRTKK
ncbi:MAG: hypothetical protein HN413_01460 [Chloroflexi bacterium]|jgi:hypothetical protein|nr:hypothetical protein [Chloroflexota bacterium]